MDLMSYCANALLGIMSTDLTFFENSVPIVGNLYGIFVAVGWGLLIGNCAFQCMKAMFAGFGFETESPEILLMRTFLFGFLLIFSRDICDIGLSIGKNVIDLLGIPTSVTLTMPTEDIFSGFGASWLLVIIIGFILGFQLIKLFFEIAERYVVVAILTLLMPVGLSMGGSKSTKDICVSYIRTYISMVVMMVLNVVFLKLILSALATMPSGALVLPWCLLVVGIAKTARKADQLISKIGLNPAITGDPLGAGRGLMAMAMAARTIMSVSGKGVGAKGSVGKAGGSSQNSSASHYSYNRGGNVRNATGGTNTGGNNMAAGAAYGATTESNANTQSNNQSSNMGGSRTTANSRSASTVRFGANSTAGASSGRTQFNNSGQARVNTNRFGNQPAGRQSKGKTTTSSQGVKGGNAGITPNNTSAKTTADSAKGNANPNVKQNAKGGVKQVQRNAAKQAADNARKARFGGVKPTATVRQNAGPIGEPKTAMPNGKGVRMNPITTKVSAKPDNIEAVDTAKEVLQDIAETVNPKDGENLGS